MGRKKIMTKFLMCFAAAATVVTGILGSVPLPVKAAEEGSYTVTFEAYETESISVPRGESIILPGASYEGHYLESWVDVNDEGDVTVCTAIGKAGSVYTPEHDMRLHANWKANQEQNITITYEARIGDIQYEELEEAFANAQVGDTITVLKDCSVSKMLEVTADDIALESENSDTPVTISREDGIQEKDMGGDMEENMEEEMQDGPEFPKELACRTEKGYFTVQESPGGYNYAFYGEDYRTVDRGETVRQEKSLQMLLGNKFAAIYKKIR